MVTFKNVLTGALLLGAAAAFVSLGGASGIGARIGGGFKSFGDSLLGGFTGIGMAQADNGRIGPDPRTGTEAFDPFGNLFGNLKGLQNILDSFNNFIFPTASGAAFQPKTVNFPSGASISANTIFNPLGSGSMTGIRGNPLAGAALSRTEQTFGGTINTRAGGLRNIRGSAALFQRLERNLSG